MSRSKRATTYIVTVLLFVMGFGVASWAISLSFVGWYSVGEWVEQHGVPPWLYLASPLLLVFGIALERQRHSNPHSRPLQHGPLLHTGDELHTLDDSECHGATD